INLPNRLTFTSIGIHHQPPECLTYFPKVVTLIPLIFPNPDLCDTCLSFLYSSPPVRPGSPISPYPTFYGLPARITVRFWVATAILLQPLPISMRWQPGAFSIPMPMPMRRYVRRHAIRS